MVVFSARLPRVPSISGASAGVPSTAMPVPRVSRLVAGVDWIPTPETAMNASGQGTATVGPIRVVVAMLASGSGTARVVVAVAMRASGVGTAAVSATARYSRTMVAAGSGTSAVTPVPRPSMAASGAGSVLARAIPVMDALASGTGAAAVGLAPRLLASAEGLGTSTVTPYVVGQAVPTSVEASGSGTATVDPVVAVYTVLVAGYGEGAVVMSLAPRLTFAAAGSGTAIVAPTPRLAMAASGSGTGVVVPAPIVVMAASGLGTGTVNAAPTTIRYGVSLSADYTGPTTTWFNPPGWVALSEGFPGTNVASNVFSAIPAGTYKVWTNIIHGYNYQSFGVRVVEVSTSTVLATITAAYSSVHDLQNTSITHGGGDIRVEVYTESSFNDAEIIKTGSTVEIVQDTFPMGMNKSGTYGFSGTSPTLITGWAVRPGFSATAITSDKLVARNTNSNGVVVVEGRLTFMSALSGQSATVELMQGTSTVIASQVVASGGIDTGVMSGTIAQSSLANGDTVWMRVTKSGTGLATANTPNTYLLFR